MMYILCWLLYLCLRVMSDVNRLCSDNVASLNLVQGSHRSSQQLTAAHSISHQLTTAHSSSQQLTASHIS